MSETAARASRIRIDSGVLALFLTRSLGAEAVTLGRRIFISRAAAREIDSGSTAGRRLLRHELAHVAQFDRDGRVGFLWRYAKAYVRGRRKGLSHAAAYDEIPAEREARAAENEDSEVLHSPSSTLDPGLSPRTFSLAESPVDHPRGG